MQTTKRQMSAIQNSEDGQPSRTAKRGRMALVAEEEEGEEQAGTSSMLLPTRSATRREIDYQVGESLNVEWNGYLYRAVVDSITLDGLLNVRCASYG